MYSKSLKLTKFKLYKKAKNKNSKTAKNNKIKAKKKDIKKFLEEYKQLNKELALSLNEEKYENRRLQTQILELKKQLNSKKNQRCKKKTISSSNCQKQLKENMTTDGLDQVYSSIENGERNCEREVHRDESVNIEKKTLSPIKKKYCSEKGEKNCEREVHRDESVNIEKSTSSEIEKEYCSENFPMLHEDWTILYNQFKENAVNVQFVRNDPETTEQLFQPDDDTIIGLIGQEYAEDNSTFHQSTSEQGKLVTFDLSDYLDREKELLADYQTPLPVSQDYTDDTDDLVASPIKSFPVKKYKTFAKMQKAEEFENNLVAKNNPVQEKELSNEFRPFIPVLQNNNYDDDETILVAKSMKNIPGKKYKTVAEIIQEGKEFEKSLAANNKLIHQTEHEKLIEPEFADQQKPLLREVQPQLPVLQDDQENILLAYSFQNIQREPNYKNYKNAEKKRKTEQFNSDNIEKPFDEMTTEILNVDLMRNNLKLTKKVDSMIM